MVQEFRYVTPGGLFIFFVLLGGYVVEPSLKDNLGAFAGLGAALLAIPTGWIIYQWRGYLTYRGGGLDSYWEMQILREWWHKDLPSTLTIPVGSTTVSLSKNELAGKLDDLGRRYYAYLKRYLPKSKQTQDTSLRYLSILHDVIFYGQKEHEVPRGMYGIHNTLSIIYMVGIWGILLVGIAIAIRILVVITIGDALLWTLYISLVLLVAIIAGNKWRWYESIPYDHMFMFSGLYELGGILDQMHLWAYMIVVLLFIAYLVYKSTLPWRMLKLDAELREEFITWLYQKKMNIDTEQAQSVLQEPGEKPHGLGNYIERGPRGGRVPNARTVTITSDDPLPPTQRPNWKWSRLTDDSGSQDSTSSSSTPSSTPVKLKRSK